MVEPHRNVEPNRVETKLRRTFPKCLQTCCETVINILSKNTFILLIDLLMQASNSDKRSVEMLLDRIRTVDIISI